jgi:hypothetical protein
MFFKIPQILRVGYDKKMIQKYYKIKVLLREEAAFLKKRHQKFLRVAGAGLAGRS